MVPNVVRLPYTEMTLGLLGLKSQNGKSEHKSAAGRGRATVDQHRESSLIFATLICQPVSLCFLAEI